MQLDTFKAVARHFKNSKTEWPMIRNGLGSEIQDSVGRFRSAATPNSPGNAASGASSEKRLEDVLGLLCAAYSGTTQTASVPGAIVKGSNFIVLRYQPRSGESMLRPFIAGPEGDGPLSAERFLSMVEYVIGLDQVNHPEWF